RLTDRYTSGTMPSVRLIAVPGPSAGSVSSVLFEQDRRLLYARNGGSASTARACPFAQRCARGKHDAAAPVNPRRALPGHGTAEATRTAASYPAPSPTVLPASPPRVMPDGPEAIPRG